jgi:glycogen debranching enzyme
VFFDVTVPARDAASLTLHVVPLEGPGQTDGPYPALDESFARILRAHEEWEASCIKVWTDHAMLNALIRRSLHDLRLTINHTDTGLLPGAGIPWFGVPVGRDSLITSLQTLSVNPDIAYGTLRFLAQYQGQKLDPWRDEEPGKILHELRSGELAALGEVPHTPYYASLDATPLFLYVVAQLVRWTGDWQFVASLGPTIDGALRWIEQYADRDGDGLVEYASGSPGGMRHHAWKDSHDAVQFADGRQPEVPVAPVEVQAYCYGAELGMAELYRRWGRPERADALVRSAQRRKERFEETFWMEDQSYYAQALDARKVPVPAVTSNPGHCLLMDLLQGPRADAVAERLTRDDMLSGWGVRTLSSAYPSFNPMSYHNGSIWPHDNSLVAAGLRHSGYDAAGLQVMDQILRAGLELPSYRMPELFCGFSRDQTYHSAPATYPLSCTPQAWAAGAVFLILQHLVGIEPDLLQRRLSIRPALLPWLNELRFENLRLGDRRLSIQVWRKGERVKCEVRGAEGLEVLVS